MIQISTSVGCKVMCSYCPQSPHIKAYRETVKGTGPYKMSLQTFITCIDKLPPKHPVCFAGFSEPFLNPQTVDMIEYCKSKRIRFDIYTTFVGLNIQQFERVMAANPFKIVVHLPDVEGYMKNPPSGKEYFEILNRLKTYIDRGYRIRMMCIGTPVPELIEGFGQIEISFPHITSRDNTNEETNGHEYLDNKYKNADIKNGISVERNYIGGPVGCKKSSGLRETHILPNGDVYACCQDWKLDLKICNLLTDSWDDHTKGRLKLFKQQLSNGPTKCHTCDFAKRIKFKENDTIDSIAQYLCDKSTYKKDRNKNN